VAALRFAPPLTLHRQRASSDRFAGVRVVVFRVVNGRSFSWEISMRLAGSCHQEWGYLAPSRRSMWKMRLFIFAAAIGASASGAVCCSLIYRPAAEASVAEHTLMPATEPTASVEKTTDMSQARLRIDSCSPADPGRVEDAGVLAPTSGAPRTRGRPDCPNRAGAEGPSPGSIAANVQTGTADSPAVSPSLNERASTSTASEVPGARRLRAPSKTTRAVVRTALRYGSYAAAWYQPWYGARERGSYGLQSRYGSYGDPAYQ
jgi:hypothetical protein